MRSSRVLLVLNIFVLSFSLASVRIYLAVSRSPSTKYVLTLLAQIFGTEGASYLIDFSEP